MVLENRNRLPRSTVYRKLYGYRFHRIVTHEMQPGLSRFVGLIRIPVRCSDKWRSSAQHYTLDVLLFACVVRLRRTETLQTDVWFGPGSTTPFGRSCSTAAIRIDERNNTVHTVFHNCRPTIRRQPRRRWKSNTVNRESRVQASGKFHFPFEDIYSNNITTYRGSWNTLFLFSFVKFASVVIDDSEVFTNNERFVQFLRVKYVDISFPDTIFQLVNQCFINVNLYRSRAETNVNIFFQNDRWHWRA